jgi:dipeptidase E
VKLLLTSAGITNQSIRGGLEDLLKKPIASSKVVLIPTAIHAMEDGGLYAWQIHQGHSTFGWKQISILELTTFPSIEKSHWMRQLRAADAILVDGGNTPYLSYWMRESGLAGELPELLEDIVYIGASAGSLVVAHSFNINQEKLEKTGVYEDDEYGDTAPMGAGSDFTLKLVDFTLRPHLNNSHFHHASLEGMEKAAAKVDVPLYAIDDRSAIKVDGNDVTVISEGEWKLFNGGNVVKR